MKMMKTLLAACLTIAPATANAFETDVIFRHKDWLVAVEIYDSGGLACTAKTRNRYGDIFDLTVYPSSNITMWMFFGDDVDFGRGFIAETELHVGYEIWELDNVEYQDSTATFDLPQNRKAIEFLNDLQRESAIALKRNDRRSMNFATWSLAGSSRAIDSLIGCWNKIKR